MNLKNIIRKNLWLSISSAYEAENYNHAILDAFHFLTEIIREKSGLDGDGVSLIHQAFGGDHPRLRINRFQTESEKNEQRGLHHILRGLYQGVRNPRSHELIEDNKDTADSIILFIDYLLNQIDESQKLYTIEEFLDRVFDSDFVESHRYAELLVEEIPDNKLFDTIVEIIRKKNVENASQIELVVKIIFERLDENQRQEIIDIISDELKITKSQTDIRLLIQILPKNNWFKIDEAARLRVENKLVNSVKEGQIDIFTDKLTDGVFGTWINKIINDFSMKRELLEVLHKKFEGDLYENAYVSKYFLSHIPKLSMNQYSQNKWIDMICDHIENENKYVREYLEKSIHAYPNNWKDPIIERLEGSLDDEDYVNVLDVDDIPF